jgi:hypothetical protein
MDNDDVFAQLNDVQSEFDAALTSELQYISQELPKIREQRSGALQELVDAYRTDPRNQVSPSWAGLNAAMDDALINPWGMNAAFNKGVKEQQQLLQNNRINAAQKVIDSTNDKSAKFYDLYSKVRSAQEKWMPKTSVVNGALVEYDPNTRATRVMYHNFRDSPLYLKMYENFLKHAEHDRTVLPEGMSAEEYASIQADTEMKKSMKYNNTQIVGQQAPAQPTNMTSIMAPQPTAPVNPQLGTEPPASKPNYNFSMDISDPKQKDLFIKGFGEYIAREENPELANQAKAWFAKTMDPENKNTIVQIPQQAQAAVAPMFANATQKTPQQLAMEKQQYENYAKEYDADRAAASGIRNMMPSMAAMEAILADPNMKMVTGPAHEKLVSLSGYMNYLDPEAKFVQAGNSVPTYFANLMNLVRDKIKALGSGTAVSNLDLIVSQKSVGDLRNTPEGNRKLLAIMALQNATMGDLLGNKISYFEGNNGKGYLGYNDIVRKRGDEPTHMVRRDPNSGRYYVQSREEWLAEQRDPKAAAKDWKNVANGATARLLSGTGIKFQGKVR